MKVKTIKMCDLTAELAAMIFAKINNGKVVVDRYEFNGEYVIFTDVEPAELTYPEGWYYANGNFRNKHTSTTGFYGEIPMLKHNGNSWRHSATYCTLDS